MVWGRAQRHERVAPLPQPRLVRYALGLPHEMRAMPGQDQPVLQEAMKGVLPEPIAHKPGQARLRRVLWLGPEAQPAPSGADGGAPPAWRTWGCSIRISSSMPCARAALGVGDVVACRAPRQIPSPDRLVRPGPPSQGDGSGLREFPPARRVKRGQEVALSSRFCRSPTVRLPTQANPAIRVVG